jgi:cobalt/nickel transport system permease protein
MHMADALISPAVGGTMWAATAGLITYSSKRVKEDLDDRKVPLMGVLGAFIFTAQMINFAIPGTGSSGHLGGGMILSILLGPCAAFLTIASVLFVQALFLQMVVYLHWAATSSTSSFSRPSSPTH